MRIVEGIRKHWVATATSIVGTSAGVAYGAITNDWIMAASITLVSNTPTIGTLVVGAINRQVRKESEIRKAARQAGRKQSCQGASEASSKANPDILKL